MLSIKFRYKDRFTHGHWAYQSCEMESVEDCIRFYGLKDGCEDYEILETKKIK